MAYWQETIDIKEEWKRAKSGDLSVQELAAAVAKKLSALNAWDSTLNLIIEALENMARDERATADDFDRVWETLYDWADNGHRLWVKVF